MLDEYAENQWEVRITMRVRPCLVTDTPTLLCQMIQHFMVGSTIEGIQPPSKHVLGLLQRSQLMSSA